MQQLASLLLGIGNGGVYAALGLALVLTYRSSGVINFATGAIALFSAYTYASLRNGQLLILIPGLPQSVSVGGPLSFFPAAGLALALTAALGALLYLVIFRPLRDAPPLARAVASLGVLVVIQTLIVNRVGTSPVSVPTMFPADLWKLGSLTILSDRFYLAITIIVLTFVIIAVYRWTRIGLVTKASAESQVGAFVSGVSPDRVALLNWMISAAVAGFAGILIAPLSPLTPISYTLFVVPALAAAVVGGFQNLGPTVAAGFAIGMLQAEVLALAQRYSWLPQSGAAELVPLIVILAALLITRRAMPVRGTLIRHPLGRAPRPRSLFLPTVGGLVAGVVALVITDGTWRGAVIGSFIAGIIALSYVVLTGYAGQVSLAQLALAGCAAFSLSFLTESWGVPFPIAPLIAALVSTVIGIVVGLPALRFRGLTLGIVTLALAYAIEAAWFENSQIVGEAPQVVEPKILGIDLSVGTGHSFPRISFGLLCLTTFVIVAWCVARLRKSAFGSAMLAVRANERSAAGIGVNVVFVKVASFAIASFIAGLSGCLLAYRFGIVTSDSFTALGGLTLLSTAYIAGITSVWGGVNAGILASGGLAFVVTDRWLHLGNWFPLFSGLALIATVIFNPEGIASGGHRFADRLARTRERWRRKPSVEPITPVPGEELEPKVTVEPAVHGDEDVPVLEIENLTVHYGGVVAVSNVTLRIRAGEVVGLIGPNGAGKTSVIDAISGFVPYTGRICLAQDRLDEYPPHTRVRRGLARTFQSLELYDDLTVEENVSASLLGARAGDRHHGAHRALSALGIEGLSDRHAGELSQGERQLVSIARATAVEPIALLLDEPAAGLDTTETMWLGEKIRGIADSGVGVLLVDHDVELVLTSCGYIYVLDLGKMIAEGGPETIQSNQAVTDAYFGHSIPDSAKA